MEAGRRHFETSDELCEYVAEICPDVLVSFSLGKDSLAAWLHMRKYFRSVNPFFMYMIPGLEFVENALKYYTEGTGDCGQNVCALNVTKEITRAIPMSTVGWHGTVLHRH